jgi:hypothetical protein
MQCSQAEILLEDYKDGELDPLTASQIEAHLMSCPNCVRLLDVLHREDKLYADYGRALDDSLEIGDSMWERISCRAEAETCAGNPLSRWSFWGYFSNFLKNLPISLMGRQLIIASFLVIMSICGTLFVVRYHQKNSISSEIKPSPQITEQRSRDLESALFSIRRAEQEYMEAIGALNAIVDRKRDLLDPDLAAKLDKNMKAIDEAIASSRQAYHAHPADPELARHMLAAYQKKVGLLQDLALDNI